MNQTEKFDFDTIIDRRRTHSAKWDTMDLEYGVPDMIQMGVADMDFMSPEPVLDAVRRVADRGVL
ncbi:MAG: pyridoxal phosphate-dependent aminotransferase, partial [Eisenbergiella sp.]